MNKNKFKTMLLKKGQKYLPISEITNIGNDDKKFPINIYPVIQNMQIQFAFLSDDTSIRRYDKLNPH